MSLIFEALQKLNKREELEEGQESRPGDRGNTKGLLKVIFSPGVLIFVLVVAGVGYFSYFSLKGDEAPRETGVAMAINPSQERVGGTASESKSEEEFQEALPPPPSHDEAKDLRPSSSDGPKVHQAEPASLPPQGRRVDKKDTTASRARSRGSLKRASIASVQGTGKQAFSSSRKGVSAPDNDRAPNEKPQIRVTSPSDKSEEENVYLRSVEISSLVSRFYEAVGAGDDLEAEKLINRLELQKGPDHPFIMKVKAYWHMKREKWALAKEELNKVLSKSPDDLEAGINMALVEIREGKIEDAIKRLKRLRGLYPDQGPVNDLLAKLPSGY